MEAVRTEYEPHSLSSTVEESRRKWPTLTTSDAGYRPSTQARSP